MARDLSEQAGLGLLSWQPRYDPSSWEVVWDGSARCSPSSWFQQLTGLAAVAHGRQPERGGAFRRTFGARRPA